MPVVTRRSMLTSSSVLFAKSAPLPLLGSTQYTASNGRKMPAPPKFSNDLHEFVTNHTASVLSKAHQGTLTPKDLHTAALNYHLYGRHVSSIGFPIHVPQSSGSATASSFSIQAPSQILNRVQARFTTHNPEFGAEHMKRSLASFPAPDPVVSAKVMQYSLSDVLHFQADAFKELSGILKLSIASGTYQPAVLHHGRSSDFFSFRDAAAYRETIPHPHLEMVFTCPTKKQICAALAALGGSSASIGSWLNSGWSIFKQMATASTFEEIVAAQKAYNLASPTVQLAADALEGLEASSLLGPEALVTGLVAIGLLVAAIGVYCALST